MSNQRYARVKFETYLNSICYIIVFLLFSWDKFYYILKKESNNAINYFVLKNFEICPLHNSYNCGCQLENKKDETIPVIQKYIDFYKFCSAIVEVQDKKIKLVRKKSKINAFNEKY